MRSETEVNEIIEKYIMILKNNPSVKLWGKSVREIVRETGLGAFTQYLKVIEVRPLEDYRLWCRLITGEIKIYDFTPQLELPMFKYLKDKSKFNNVEIVGGVPAWVDDETGERDLDIGITWILHHGIDVSE
jgi:hypothetical protein